jgi:hypothetical protein
MGCRVGLECFARVGVVKFPSCKSMAPIPYTDASTWRKDFLIKLG